MFLGCTELLLTAPNTELFNLRYGLSQAKILAVLRELECTAAATNASHRQCQVDRTFCASLGTTTRPLQSQLAGNASDLIESANHFGIANRPKAFCCLPSILQCLHIARPVLRNSPHLQIRRRTAVTRLQTQPPPRCAHAH
jgi:hypothetical protein